MRWLWKIRTFMRLKNVIRSNGIKQSWVAKKLGISPAYLSLVLNRKRRLTDKLESDFNSLINNIKGE